MHRYTLLRMKTKRMAGTGKWVSCVKARTNPKSCLLKFCELVLQHGYGHELCQVQAIDTTHAWVCVMEENSIGNGCVKMKLNKINQCSRALGHERKSVLHVTNR